MAHLSNIDDGGDGDDDGDAKEKAASISHQNMSQGLGAAVFELSDSGKKLKYVGDHPCGGYHPYPEGTAAHLSNIDDGGDAISQHPASPLLPEASDLVDLSSLENEEFTVASCRRQYQACIYFDAIFLTAHLIIASHHLFIPSYHFSSPFHTI